MVQPSGLSSFLYCFNFFPAFTRGFRCLYLLEAVLIVFLLGICLLRVLTVRHHEIAIRLLNKVLVSEAPMVTLFSLLM